MFGVPTFLSGIASGERPSLWCESKVSYRRTKYRDPNHWIKPEFSEEVEDATTKHNDRQLPFILSNTAHPQGKKINVESVRNQFSQHK